MLIKKVVINSSPLIALFKSQQSQLLPQLFDKILVPEAVWNEITLASKNDEASQQLPHVNWSQKIEKITIQPEVAAWDLGKGESEVLSFALNNPSYAAIVDDRAAKNCAQALGIVTIGTGGVLLLAKRRGLITNITPRLEALQNSGLWLSERVINLIKKQAGE
jgi:predicted nucleic acid-binding protein